MMEVVVHKKNDDRRIVKTPKKIASEIKEKMKWRKIPNGTKRDFKNNV